jgi:hypothetical protein
MPPWSKSSIGANPAVNVLTIRAVTLELARTATRPRGSPIAYGREAVRTQSAILDETLHLSLFLSITAFSARMAFIRAENGVGARERAMAALGMRRNLRRRI